MKTHIDLNADLGEGFGPWAIGENLDEALMPLITSANVATGFHAGDPNTMRNMVRLARQHGVGIGAHPGFRDLVGFGRRHIAANAEELVNDLIYQIGALREFARLAGAPLQHVKPHGALYMHAARDPAFADALVDALQATDPALRLFCMAGSVVHRVALAKGQPVVREFYADRDYDRSGAIVFARRADALAPEVVASKVLRACREGRVRTLDGADVAIEFDSVCIHSDTPGALALLKATRATLGAHGVRIVNIVDADAGASANVSATASTASANTHTGSPVQNES